MTVYKTVLQVTILSESPKSAHQDLADIAADIETGFVVGTTEFVTINAKVPMHQVQRELVSLGNDGTFFGEVDNDHTHSAH